MSAGELINPVKFQRRASTPGDKFARGAGGWGDLFAGAPIFVKLRPRNAGGEENVGLRLEGRQPWEMLVRRDPDTVTLTNADSVVPLEDGLPDRFNIKGIAPFPADPDYLLATLEAGPT